MNPLVMKYDITINVLTRATMSACLSDLPDFSPSAFAQMFQKFFPYLVKIIPHKKVNVHRIIIFKLYITPLCSINHLAVLSLPPIANK